MQALLEADLPERGVAERDANTEAVAAFAPALGQFAGDVAHLDAHLHPRLT
jgi:hypothetical protein